MDIWDQATSTTLASLENSPFPSSTIAVHRHPCNFSQVCIDYKTAVKPLIRDTLTSGGILAVNTFFFLSGFLAVATMQSKVQSVKQIPYMYLLRYLRLTPLYFVVVVCFTYLLPSLGEGPMWGTFTSYVTGMANFCPAYGVHDESHPC